MQRHRVNKRAVQIKNVAGEVTGRNLKFHASRRPCGPYPPMQTKPVSADRPQNSVSPATPFWLKRPLVSGIDATTLTSENDLKIPSFRALPTTPLLILPSPPLLPARTETTPSISDRDLCAILGVCDCLIARAGRTTLALALRGSRSKRVVQHGVDEARGYGYFAGLPEEEVLARIDALIADGVLRPEHRDGYPLLAYTDRGLQLAMRCTAEDWLVLLRSRVPLVAKGAAPGLPPVMAAIQDRNQDTVLLLADRVSAEADVT
ncbi:MAG: hypothetical protein EXS37_16275 [Opitutus sp.]|nr:hypothetical protein [Opitutus sp.]